MDVALRISGGFNGGAENRVLNWEELEFKNEEFGIIKERSRWVNLDALDEEFLKTGWMTGDVDKAGPSGEANVLVSSKNEERGWTVSTVWGFADVHGKRYHVRKVVCKKNGEVVRVRGVYDRHEK
jgi:hypothetical protein